MPAPETFAYKVVPPATPRRLGMYGLCDWPPPIPPYVTMEEERERARAEATAEGRKEHG